MKKILLFVTAAAMLLTVSCSNTQTAEDAVSQAAPQAVVSATSEAISSETQPGKDYTITLDNTLNLDDYKNQLDHTEKITYESCHAYYCANVNEMIEQCTDVVKAKVNTVQYIHDEYGTPYTVFDIQVLKSYKGDLNEGDTISVAISDGYVNMYDYVTLGNLEHRYTSIPVKEQKKRLVEIKGYFDEPYPAVGDIDILPLLEPGFDNRTNPVPGAYWPINDAETIYKTDKNGKYTRLYNTQVKEGQYKLNKNDIDGFTLEWFEAKFNKS